MSYQHGEEIPTATTPNSTSWGHVPGPLSGPPPIRNGAFDQGFSPQTITSQASEPTSLGGLNTLQRWQTLARSLAARNFEMEHIINRCFHLFFKYLYPLIPLVPEPALRDGLNFSLSHFPLGGVTSVSTSRWLALQEAWAAYILPQPAAPAPLPSHPPDLWLDATFTLVTVVCAEAAFLLPKDVFPEGESVADIFLRASRACLNSYLEADLEGPNSTSITIRYFQSNCLHAAGRSAHSWHIFGEATRLVQVMNLNNEASYDGLPNIEAELRRRAFWIVYMGDKSAAILNNRPITIHKYSFVDGITASYPIGTEEDSASDTPNSLDKLVNHPPRSFITGFNANLRLFQTASDLLIEMRLLQDRQHQDPTHQQPPGTATFHHPVNAKFILSPKDHERLDALYIKFITCLDDLPPYLHSHNGAADLADSNRFVTQRANLQVSLHCLRMVITQKLEEGPYVAPGMDQGDLRKTEIARDMVAVMRDAPFWALQVNGEPYVSVY